MTIENVRLWRCPTFVVLLTLFVVGCGQIAGSGRAEVVRSSDGKFQITKPSGWTVQSELNDEADRWAEQAEQMGRFGRRAADVRMSSIDDPRKSHNGGGEFSPLSSAAFNIDPSSGVVSLALSTVGVVRR